MTEFITNFHFLRPMWFLAMLPAVLLFASLYIRQGSGSNWSKAIAEDLLPHLMDMQQQQSSRNPLKWVMVAWILTTIGLAGPVWQKTPQPVHKKEDALVIVFDLTRSMYAEDVKPNRLVRARRKLLDLLDKRKEGVTGLIVFAGDAHVVSPLSDDAKTIKELIPAISPDIMPAAGSSLTSALVLAKKLFKDGGLATGRILIVTDEIRDMAKAQSLARQFYTRYPVSILAIGTPKGAPIPVAEIKKIRGQNKIESTYLKDRNGDLVVAKVNMQALQDFAINAGGRFSQMTLIDADLDYLLAENELDEQSLNQESYREVDRDFDVWFEEGPWFLLLILPIVLISFRRGWLWCLVFIIMSPSEPTYASVWDDLWYSKDQQGARALKQGETAEAASLFDDIAWKAAAQYKSEDFAAAASNFATAKSSDAYYNLGNALAKQKQFKKAIEAFDQALQLDAANDDAKFNKQLVEKLLEQEQKEQQKQQEQEDNQDSEENKDQENKEKSDQQSDQKSEQSKEGEESEQESEQGEEQEAEKQDEAEQQGQQDEQEAKDQQMSEQDEPAPLSEEEQQALQQWLKRVPDDPGGLLRRKFEMQYNERMKQRRRGRDETSNW